MEKCIAKQYIQYKKIFFGLIICDNQSEAHRTRTGVGPPEKVKDFTNFMNAFNLIRTQKYDFRFSSNLDIHVLSSFAAKQTSQSYLSATISIFSSFPMCHSAAHSPLSPHFITSPISLQQLTHLSASGSLLLTTTPDSASPSIVPFRSH